MGVKKYHLYGILKRPTRGFGPLAGGIRYLFSSRPVANAKRIVVCTAFKFQAGLCGEILGRRHTGPWHNPYLAELHMQKAIESMKDD